jgi:hypothetical protein
MDLEFSGDIWYWRGPAPWYFVSTPPEESDAIKAVANMQGAHPQSGKAE